MSVNRRFVLKGMALSGITGLTMSGSFPVLAAPITTSVDTGTTRPLSVLTNGGLSESLFTYGAQAATGQRLSIQQPGRDLGTLLNLERQLRSGFPQRLIGLLDDATAALVLDLARSAGARVLWIGHHVSNAGTTRHHLQTTDLSTHCADRFRQHLDSCRAGYSISEHRTGGHTSPALHSALQGGAQNSPEWASNIGYLLASLGERPALASPAPADNIVLTGSFVSFSVET